MAIPRVFISSTCYDLKHIRENLKYFVKTIGYEPVLSEDGDVFYGPSNHTHDACLKEVQTCQIFVLVIGGRYGGEFKSSDTSITNSEYREAVSKGIPVFALVESAVHSDHHLYATNFKKNKEFAQQINYPSSDSTKIFEFIDEVRRQSENNAIYPFKDFSDMESYLRKQWAGMMYDFLDERDRIKHSEITNKILDDLTQASRKSEELLKVLLKATSNDDADESIEKVNNYVEAEKFFKAVMNYFGLHFISSEPLDSEVLIQRNINKYWFDFLDGISDEFWLDEHDDEDGCVFKVLHSNSGTARAVGKYVDGVFEKEKNSEFERLFNSFQKLEHSKQVMLLDDVMIPF